MSEDHNQIPLPVIVLLAVLLGCLVILCVIYQLLKREMCCRVIGREGADDEEEQPFIEEGGEQHANGPGDSGAAGSATIAPGEWTGSDHADGMMQSADTTIDLSISDISFPSLHLLPVEEEEPVSTSGKLLLETTFIPVAKKMIISIVRAADIPGPERGGTAMVEVHLTVLPNRRFKFKTRQKPAASPVFNEKCVLYPVTVETLQDMSMRVRLYGKKKLSKKVLGELEIPMTDIDLHSALSDEPMWKTLLPYGMVAKLAALREVGADEEEEEEEVEEEEA